MHIDGFCELLLLSVKKYPQVNTISISKGLNLTLSIIKNPKFGFGLKTLTTKGPLIRIGDPCELGTSFKFTSS